jgi:3-keto-5-aminohexanoate cleavage enzyme
MNYILRKATQNDKQAILDVMKVWNMHHIPSLEMEELDLDSFFVVCDNDKIVGACGYKIVSKEDGKTTLLAVYPEFQGSGIGKELQDKRLEAMYKQGVKRVLTNADHTSTILWYKKHFGYKEVGRLKKIISFGLEDVNYWTTLELDLQEYFNNKEKRIARIENYIEENDPKPLSSYNPLIINVCLTGMIPTKRSTKYVPISPEEIIEDAVKVYDAGASIVHIHARDENGEPTPKAKYYEEIIIGIRKYRPDLICCVTTSGRNWKDFESRAEVLNLSGDAKPDMASLTLGSLNFISGASVNTIEMVERLAMYMKEKGIKPELEVFDLGMINLAKYMQRHEILGDNNYFNLLLGNLNTAPANMETVASIYNALPNNSTWAVAGLGKFQLPMNTAAIIAGGHVRVGLEDSIYYDYAQTTLTSNEDLVKRIVRISHELQRKISTCKQTREMIRL